MQKDQIKDNRNKDTLYICERVSSKKIIKFLLLENDF